MRTVLVAAAPILFRPSQETRHLLRAAAVRLHRSQTAMLEVMVKAGCSQHQLSRPAWRSAR